MAGAAFLSTAQAPALLGARGVAASPSVSSPARRHLHIQVYCKGNVEGIEAADHEEGLRFRRRDFISGCVGTAIGLEFIEGSTKFTGVATAADLIERRQRSEFQCRSPNIVYFFL